MSREIKHFFDETIIREYDIRGIYNETLFNVDATILGNLFGLKLGKGASINIAYDGRISSTDLKENLIKGLLEVGVNVNEIGLAPTPMLYYSCADMNINSGILQIYGYKIHLRQLNVPKYVKLNSKTKVNKQ